MSEISVTVTQSKDRELRVTWEGFWNDECPDYVQMIGILQAAVMQLSSRFQVTAESKMDEYKRTDQ